MQGVKEGLIVHNVIPAYRRSLLSTVKHPRACCMNFSLFDAHASILSTHSVALLIDWMNCFLCDDPVAETLLTCCVCIAAISLLLL